MKNYKQHYAELEPSIRTGNYSVAINKVEEAQDTYYRERDRVLYYLDLGLLHHYDGNYEKSNRYLTKAEEAIDELFTRSIRRAAASLIINDNELEYRGEDYEDIYINVIKAINYLLLDDFDGAFVEIRRIDNKLSVLDDRYNQLGQQYTAADDNELTIEAGEAQFHNSAIGRYLSMLIYRTEGREDAAQIDRNYINQAFRSQSQLYNFRKPYLDSHLKNVTDAKLNIIGYIGRAPDKKARTLYIHTERDHIIIATTEEKPRGRQSLSTLDVFPWRGVRSGYHFKFQLPYMDDRSSTVSEVKVFVNGKLVNSLSPIESIENIAEDLFERRKSIIYLKTISRAVIKGLAAERAKREMTEEIESSALSFLARAVTDAAVDATERADLRISRLFPAKILVGEVDLDPGIYDVRVEYYNRLGRKIHVDEFPDYRVEANNLNIIKTFHLR